jgi:hypothetical protein
VIPSNTLELNDGNMSRIPPNVEVLIHSDPRDFRVFLNRDKYSPPTAITSPDFDAGLFSRRFPETAELIRGFEFMLNIGGTNNVFRVNHWRILPKK